jgi:hypothetical protein
VFHRPPEDRTGIVRLIDLNAMRFPDNDDNNDRSMSTNAWHSRLAQIAATVTRPVGVLVRRGR